MNTKKNGSGLALAGLIIGTIGVLLSAVPIINNFAFALGALAVLFGIVAIVKASKADAKKGKAIASLVLGLVTIVIVLASQAMYGQAIDEVGNSLDRATGGQTEDVLKNDVTVDVGKFSVKTDEYGLATTKLPVTVTNKLSEKASFSITVEALDKDGARIESDTAYANDLAAGQTQKLNVFEYVSSEKLKDMKKATFKVSSASKS